MRARTRMFLGVVALCMPVLAVHSETNCRWGDAVPLDGEFVPSKVARKGWKSSGKPKFVGTPKKEEHALLLPSKGIAQKGVVTNVVYIDGASTLNKWSPDSFAVPPGEHEILLSVVVGNRLSADALFRVDMKVEPGHAYRFASIVEAGYFKGITRWVPLVQTNTIRCIAEESK